MNIETRIEARRGCGFRTPGGIYLVGPSLNTPCCKLPFPLTVCPCCGAGIKPTRGWTWVDASQLFFPEGHGVCTTKDGRNTCPLAEKGSIHKAGLLWIGEQYYKTPGEFLSEARAMGISRRLSTIPNGFRLGETWVLLAHRKGVLTTDKFEEGLFEGKETQAWRPAIFSVFQPTALEYIVKGGETDEDLERLTKRGLTPVKVNPRKAYK